MLHQLMNDEVGVVVSAELILILTLAVLAMVVGISEVSIAVNTELNDLSNAFGAMNQSFLFVGFHATGGKLKSFVSGSAWFDGIDDCDWNLSCDLICGGGFGGGFGGGGGIGGGGLGVGGGGLGVGGAFGG